MTRRRSENAFTLVELLVVITVITLLIALLLPSLERAKEMAYRIKCLSGGRQAALAVRQYAYDNKEYIPTHGYKPYRNGDLNNGVAGTAYSSLLVEGNYTAFPQASDAGSRPGVLDPYDPNSPVQPAVLPGGNYTGRVNFTNKGGCPYGPNTYSESSAGGEYYSDPAYPATSYGLPGSLQCGYDNSFVTGEHNSDWGPFRFSEKRLSRFSSQVAIISCNMEPWLGAAPWNPMDPPYTGGAWICEIWNAEGPQEPTAFPVLWHTLGITNIGWTDPTAARHKGDGLPMVFADTHGEFITKEEITSRTVAANWTAGPNSTCWWNPINAKAWSGTTNSVPTSTKTQYRRMLLTFAPKYFYDDLSYLNATVGTSYPTAQQQSIDK